MAPFSVSMIISMPFSLDIIFSRSRMTASKNHCSLLYWELSDRNHCFETLCWKVEIRHWRLLHHAVIFEVANHVEGTVLYWGRQLCGRPFSATSPRLFRDHFDNLFFMRSRIPKLLHRSASTTLRPSEDFNGTSSWPSYTITEEASRITQSLLQIWLNEVMLPLSDNVVALWLFYSCWIGT